MYLAFSGFWHASLDILPPRRLSGVSFARWVAEEGSGSSPRLTIWGRDRDPFGKADRVVALPAEGQNNLHVIAHSITSL